MSIVQTTMTPKNTSTHNPFKVSWVRTATGITLCLAVWLWMRGEGVEEEPGDRFRRDIHHPNLAMSMTMSFAIQMNYSNCWVCQHLPHSTTAPLWMSIPLTRDELLKYDWQKLSKNDILWDQNCHGGKNLAINPENYYRPIGLFVTVNPWSQFAQVLDFIAAEVNKDNLPAGFAKTMVLRVGGLHSNRTTARHHSEVVFSAETIHVQTNCSVSHTGPDACTRIESDSFLNCYSEILWDSIKREFKLLRLKCQLYGCPKRTQEGVTYRSSSVCNSMPILPAANVKYCFTGQPSKINVSVGESSCDSQTIMVTDLSKPSYLPEKVYAVCGGKAYTHLPANSQGLCYLAHVIPMIRRVNLTQIQAAYSQHMNKITRKKRTLNWWQKILGVIIPNYGVYNTQKELDALSMVLERHMNASDTAVSALAQEVGEIRTVTLQNRMVLDVILAAKGGACKVIGTECCSYVSDPSQAIARLHNDTQVGVQELHKNHGGLFWGLFNGWFGGITNTWTRTLILIVMTVIVLLLVFVCISTCIRAVISRILGPSSQVIMPPAARPQWVAPFHNSNIA